MTTGSGESRGCARTRADDQQRWGVPERAAELFGEHTAEVAEWAAQTPEELAQRIAQRLDTTARGAPRSAEFPGPARTYDGRDMVDFYAKGAAADGDDKDIRGAPGGAGGGSGGVPVFRLGDDEWSRFDTSARVEQALREKHGIRAFFGVPDLDIGAVRDVAQVVDYFRTAFGDGLPIEAFDLTDFATTGLAHLDELARFDTQLGIGGISVRVNSAWLTPQGLREQLSSETGAGVLSSAFGDRPAVALAFEAMATALVESGGYRASLFADQVLREFYRGSHGTEDGYLAWRDATVSAAPLGGTEWNAQTAVREAIAAVAVGAGSEGQRALVELAVEQAQVVAARRALLRQEPVDRRGPVDLRSSPTAEAVGEELEERLEIQPLGFEGVDRDVAVNVGQAIVDVVRLLPAAYPVRAGFGELGRGTVRRGKRQQPRGRRSSRGGRSHRERGLGRESGAVLDGRHSRVASGLSQRFDRSRRIRRHRQRVGPRHGHPR